MEEKFYKNWNLFTLKMVEIKIKQRLSNLSTASQKKKRKTKYKTIFSLIDCHIYFTANESLNLRIRSQNANGVEYFTFGQSLQIVAICLTNGVGIAFNKGGTRHKFRYFMTFLDCVLVAIFALILMIT